MTRSANSRRMPGATLLRIARLLFRDDLMAAVVQPTISDLQREVAAAGPNRVARLRARWRGYVAFWLVTLVVPFASWPAPAGADGAAAFRDAAARAVVIFGVLTLFAVVHPVFGAGIAIVPLTGTLVAIVIHAWYQRHPSRLPDPNEEPRRRPEIDFSSTEVAGNIGGLIFVIGSVLVVVVGLPSVFWFMLAGTIAGCALAWGLAAWHTSHPKSGLPANPIVLR
jgi:hypothetical protein